MPGFRYARAWRRGAEWSLRSGNESHVTTNIWDDSAAPLGSLACQIHGSQRSTEGGPADLHYEGRGGTLAVSDSVRDGTGAVCRSQGRQRITVGLRGIVAVHTAGPWTTAIASHARVVPMAITQNNPPPP